MSFYLNPPNLSEEIEAFENLVMDYLDRKIPKDIFKGRRVVFGVYEQREEETYMVRIRCSAGAITPKQLLQVARLSSRFGDNCFHVTTRQELQLHQIKLKHVPFILKKCLSVGLSTRGGGGNTIRNLLASHDSGVSATEVFDISPHNLALCSMLIAEFDSWNLPRKFKIAFSNSNEDTANAKLTCIGFVATIKDNQKGFKVYVAGGQGAHPSLGKLLEDFIPENSVYITAKAIKNIFNRLGNRRNSRTQGKLKFLWEKLGKEKFTKAYHQEKQNLLQDNSHSKHFDNLLRKFQIKLKAVEGIREVKKGNKQPHSQDFNVWRDFNIWKDQYAQEQKQKSLFQIKIPLPLGDIANDFGEKLAQFLLPLNVDCIRLSTDQNLYLRNVAFETLPEVFLFLKENSSFSLNPVIISNMIACTGADTCKLGICLPREITPVIQDTLLKANLPWAEISHLRIHLSGCPNACGRHHIADIGYYGKINRHQGRMYPAYALMLGGGVDEQGAFLAKKIADIPAKYVPQITLKIIQFYLEEKEKREKFKQFFVRKGKEAFLKKLILDDLFLPLKEDDPGFYRDWNQTKDISVLKGQQPECAAGLFDLISIDKKAIEKLVNDLSRLPFSSDVDSERSVCLQKLLFHSCRMLLITKGIEAETEKEIFQQFVQHFIQSGLVNEKYLPLIKFALRNTNIDKNTENNNPSLQFSQLESIIRKLSDDILDLYCEMDDSLSFHNQKQTEKAEEDFIQDNWLTKTALQSKDLRGVTCPMNFVKTKLELSKLSKGDMLEILLDDGEPISNVPASIEEEGHVILSQTFLENYWKVTIKK